MEAKKHIRKEVFARRRETPEQDIRNGSRRIFSQVVQLPEYREASVIYAYMDYNREVMTREFIEKAWREGKRVAVPRVVGQDMIFYLLESFDQLEEGYYGIPEPVSGVLADTAEALMIVPGVAFDEQRRRIGYGGGFYDRYLSRHRRHTTVAVAFEFQIFQELPAEPTDIRPEILITEKRIFR